jgi:hypothetical protein
MICMRLFRLTSLMVLVALAAGCYYYTPLEQPDPQSGTYLQVNLTDSGTSHFWSYLGPDVGDLRGRLINADDRSLALAVEAVDLRHGQMLSWKGETVSLGREYVAHLEERHLSKSRTTLLALGSVAAFIASIKAIQFIGIGARSGGGPPPPR